MVLLFKQTLGLQGTSVMIPFMLKGTSNFLVIVLPETQISANPLTSSPNLSDIVNSLLNLSIHLNELVDFSNFASIASFILRIGHFK